MALVLIVDDRHDVLDGMAKLLRRAGHQVLTASNANDAVCRLAEKPPPELMVLDLMLGGGADGRWVLDQLGPSAPPVIIWTGNDEQMKDFEQLKDFAGTKVKRVLPKALTEPEEIVVAINEVLAMNGGHELPAAPAAEGGC